MDYFKLGQRIRKYRKAMHMTQEELADKVSISLPHMSHIETGNTKLSLPVLVKIAEALSVRIDDIVYDKPPINKSDVKQEISNILDSCSDKKALIIIENVKSLKITLDKFTEL